MSEDSLFEEALNLPLDRRAALAAALIRSLDGEPEEGVEAAWAEEVERRAREVLAGEVPLEEWSAVRDRARDRLKRG